MKCVLLIDNFIGGIEHENRAQINCCQIGFMITKER